MKGRIIIVLCVFLVVAGSIMMLQLRRTDPAGHTNNANPLITEDMKFRASFCDPLKPDIIELGEIEKDKIMELFGSIPWSEHLAKMQTVKEGEIYYSPSLEVENKDNRNGIVVSAIDGREWYIFYKRPKLVGKFFGLMVKMDDNYLTEVLGQTEMDVRNCLEALLNNDLQFLEDKIR